MTQVYAWPPVKAISRAWTVRDPIAVSQSLITGAEFVSASQRRRRIAVIEASSIFSPHAAGSGYMEALKMLLKGGVNLVRLTRKTTRFDCSLAPDNQRGAQPIEWIVPPTPFPWVVPPAEIEWFDGEERAGTLTTLNGFPAISVSGLPPETLVALPGEFAVIAGSPHMVLKPSYSNDVGVAVVALVTQPASGGAVTLGGYDTGVFKVDTLPVVVQPGSGDWSYTWEFTEVFEDERGPFVEVDPWS